LHPQSYNPSRVPWVDNAATETLLTVTITATAFYNAYNDVLGGFDVIAVGRGFSGGQPSHAARKIPIRGGA
jgi:hypothetical protein